MDRERATIIGTPLALLLIGGAVGWFMRDDSSPSSTKGTAVGITIPIGAALDAAAPRRALRLAPNAMVIDRSNLIGYPDNVGTHVPAGAVVPLALDGKGGITPLDARSLQPASNSPARSLPPTEPKSSTHVEAPAVPPSTAAPTDSTTTVASARPGFVDPCTTAKGGCPGAEARVLAAPTDAARPLDPLVASVPFAATGAYAAMCNTIEAGNVPDTFLSAATRPTVAVVVNQPSTIALSGTWGDGSALDKLTMVTSADFDQQWQAVWDTEHTQRSLLACITLPLDDVRTHASGGRVTLNAGVLAISATGRVQLDGPLTLTVPLDGEDPPFVDQLTVGSLGEQRQPDGTLAATVHVHYAVANDTIIPTTSRLSARSAKVYGEHAFVENADCAGWANNAQGLDRAIGGDFSIALEQRTIVGRGRPVVVVDGDVVLDPTLPGGWNGFLCVKLFAADADGHRVTVALRGAPVRSPRTATYSVGVVLDPTGFPEGWKLVVAWTRPDGTTWCGPIDLKPSAIGASCTTFARSAPDGIRLVVRPTDKDGAVHPAFVVKVPVNTAYCNPDDPFASMSDGCSTGFAEHLKVPLGVKGKQSANVSLQVLREAAQGSISNNPSHAWQIDATLSFAI